MSLAAIFSLLESHSGLIINSAHRLFMENLIRERTASLGLPISDYEGYVRANPEELKFLTDEAAINETYFFREEQHFDFLKEHFFPRQMGKKLSLWSAACSTGEEVLSLYALAKHCGQQVDVYASDIDTSALAKLRAGIYEQNSLRVDGQKYASLLDAISRKEGDKLSIDEAALKEIKSFYYNLSSTELPPFSIESIDLIFIRNVFIYFSPQMRHDILLRLGRMLKTGGLLFLSVNEIASIECTPDMFLEKEHTGNIYYLKKAPLIPPQQAPVQHETLPRKPVSLSKPRPVMVESTPPHAEALKPHKDETIEAMYAQFSKKLEAEDTEQAEKIFKDTFFPPHNLEFKYYFLGLLSLQKHEKAEALDSFTKSTLLNKEFWPAWFQLGMVQKQEQNEKAAEQAFSSCAKAIESYIQNGKTCYNFLISQFSPEYFLLLCRNYMGKQG